MVNESITFNGVSIEFIEQPLPPLKKNSYLVKTIHVFLNGLENAIVEGYIPLKKTPIVLGSTGIVRILEHGYGAEPSYSGLIAFIKPVTRDGVIGWSIDGLLSKYSTIPSDSILTTLSDAKPEYTLLYSIGLGVEASKYTSGRNLLIIGGGLSGIAAAFSSRNALRVSIFTEKLYSYRFLKKHGFEAYRKWSDLHGCYDLIYYSTLTPNYMNLLNNLLSKDSIVLLNPLYTRLYAISLKLYSKGSILIKNIELSKETIPEAYKLLDKLYGIVKTIKVDSLKQTLGLIPIKGAGAIISLT